MYSTRRAFIKKAGLASAGLVALPSVAMAWTVTGRVNAVDRITMAVIGCGSRANDNMDAFMSNDDVRIVAVCDIDKGHLSAAKKRADDKYGNRDCRTYTDFRELLEKEKTDAAILCLPDHWHSYIACAAADKKIHIYGEKPLARSLAESRAIVNAVKRNGIIWQTGSQQRSSREFLHACELVRNRRIGKVDYVEVSLHNGGAYMGNPKVMQVPDGVDWDMWLGPAPAVPYRGIMHGYWRSPIMGGASLRIRQAITLILPTGALTWRIRDLQLSKVPAEKISTASLICPSNMISHAFMRMV